MGPVSVCQPLIPQGADDLQKQLVPFTSRETEGAIGLAASHAKEVNQQISKRTYELQWRLAPYTFRVCLDCCFHIQILM